MRKFIYSMIIIVNVLFVMADRSMWFNAVAAGFFISELTNEIIQIKIQPGAALDLPPKAAASK